MTFNVRDVVRSVRAAPVFSFYIVAALIVAGVIGLITFDIINLGMSHFGDPSHRTHDVAYGLLFTTGVVGLLAQLLPGRNGAAMLMAIIPGAALALAAVLSNDIGTVLNGNPLRYVAAIAAVAALLFPAMRTLVRSFAIARINWWLLALVAVAAGPLFGYASSNISRQRTVEDMHAVMGHYGFVAALSFAIVAVGVLASARPDGWRLTAWVAGAVPMLLGITSLIDPEITSSLELPWALAAIAWGAAFLATARFTTDISARRDTSTATENRLVSHP
jgi:hypothetical protein